ncbi:SCO family protein [Crenobacter sp. SG2305]|uniref:SCO family protein n=1 Tax=Crenobacter oryzisoli TaxID=3056844 RepID=UPI0025AB4684|nr:SCO family protein [Crenobacter sp. SG2305]MDN0084312.1 SCO family protein [Crenobacter sp. SG2305]
MRTVFRFLVAGLLLAGLVACGPSKPPALPFKGTDIAGVDFGGDFTLTDQTGKSRSLSDYKGKVVALFFGYTHCPDVCPTTMFEFANAMKQLGAGAKNVQVLFVTVDPERDTPAVLAGYVPHFDPSFVGLTGNPGQIEKVTSQFKIVAQKQPTEGGGYTVDHSAGSYLFDREGRLRAYEPYGAPAGQLANDIQLLLR